MYIIYERSKKEHGNPADGEYGRCLVIDQLIFQILMGLLGRPFIWNLLFVHQCKSLLARHREGDITFGSGAFNG